MPDRCQTCNREVPADWLGSYHGRRGCYCPGCLPVMVRLTDPAGVVQQQPDDSERVSYRQREPGSETITGRRYFQTW